MSLKKNIIANYIGYTVTLALNFLLIPLYVKYLGTESYGLIGLFAVLQLALGIIDASISPVLSREISRYVGGERSLISTKKLIRTMEILIFLVTLTFSLIIYLFSNYIAQYWLNPENLPLDVVSNALKICGFVVGLRCLEGFYKSILTGLQLQTTLNKILCLGNLFRSLGALAVLHYYSSTISVYFYWQLIASLFIVIGFAMASYKHIPDMFKQRNFDFKELATLKSYAFYSVLYTILVFLLTQIDKIITSKYLSLSTFGYYSISASIANIILIINEPVVTAFFPKLITLYSQKDEINARIIFHKCSKFIVYLCGIATAVLIAFGKELILFWSNNEELTSGVYPIVSIIAIGSFFSSLVRIPITFPFVVNKPKPAIISNSTALVIIAIISIPLIKKYGVQGAAAINVIQSVIIFAFFPTYFKNFLPNEKFKWLLNDVVVPAILISIIVFILKYLTSVLICIQQNI